MGERANIITYGTPTRFPKGIVNRPKDDPLGMFGMPDWTKYHIYFNDFDSYVAGDWTVTESSASGTQALTDIDGGALLLTNAANDDFLNALQLLKESFLPAAGKRMWFKTRFKVSDATQSDVVVGLQVRDTSPLAVSDGIYFLKADGAATVDAKILGSSAATTGSAIATLVSDTFIELAWFYNGKDEVQFFVDGNKVSTLATTNLPATELAVSFAVQNGEAAAKTMTVDYIFAAKER